MARIFCIGDPYRDRVLRSPSGAYSLVTRLMKTSSRLTDTPRSSSSPHPWDTIAVARSASDVGVELAFHGVARRLAVAAGAGTCTAEHPAHRVKLRLRPAQAARPPASDTRSAPFTWCASPSGVSMATSLPLLMMTTRLQVMLTSGRMWVERMTVCSPASALISERTSEIWLAGPARWLARPGSGLRGCSAATAPARPSACIPWTACR